MPSTSSGTSSESNAGSKLPEELEAAPVKIRAEILLVLPLEMIMRLHLFEFSFSQAKHVK